MTKQAKNSTKLSQFFSGRLLQELLPPQVRPDWLPRGRMLRLGRLGIRKRSSPLLPSLLMARRTTGRPNYQLPPPMFIIFKIFFF